MLVSAAQQSESATHTHTYPSLLRLPPMPTPHAIPLGRRQAPTEVPALYRGFPLAVFHAWRCTQARPNLPIHTALAPPTGNSGLPR